MNKLVSTNQHTMVESEGPIDEHGEDYVNNYYRPFAPDTLHWFLYHYRPLSTRTEESPEDNGKYDKLPRG